MLYGAGCPQSLDRCSPNLTFAQLFEWNDLLVRLLEAYGRKTVAGETHAICSRPLARQLLRKPLVARSGAGTGCFAIELTQPEGHEADVTNLTGIG